MKSKYLSSGDAAKITGLTSQAIILAAEEGRLPTAFRTAGGIRIFRREDVEHFAKAREAKRSNQK